MSERSMSTVDSSYPATPSTPTNLTFNRKSLDLALVEDPLLAMAAANVPKPHPSPYMSRFGPTSPLLPPDSPLLAVKAPAEPVVPMDTFVDYERMDMQDSLSVPDQTPNLFQAQLVVHAKVYAIAEQYGIQRLKSLAKKKFAAQVAYHRNSDEFAESLREVYETTIETDRGLRDIVIQTFRQFPELAQRKDVADAVKETTGLAWELFRVGWGLPI